MGLYHRVSVHETLASTLAPTIIDPSLISRDFAVRRWTSGILQIFAFFYFPFVVSLEQSHLRSDSFFFICLLLSNLTYMRWGHKSEIWKKQRILLMLFFKRASDLCWYLLFTWFKPSHLHCSQCMNCFCHSYYYNYYSLLICFIISLSFIF